MHIDDFRMIHSNLIGEYQLVEEKLRYIYLIFDKKGYRFDYDFVDYWTYLNKKSMSQLMKFIKEKDSKYKSIIFNNELISLLDKVREKRNFWVHQCYLKLVFRHNGESKWKELDNWMDSDMNDAKRLILILIDTIDKVKQVFNNLK